MNTVGNLIAAPVIMGSRLRGNDREWSATFVDDLNDGVLPHGLFLRTASHRGRRRRLPACAADGRFSRMGRVAGGKPRFPDAVGADLAARRPDARFIPPAPEALRRGLAQRPGLPVLPAP